VEFVIYKLVGVKQQNYYNTIDLYWIYIKDYKNQKLYEYDKNIAKLIGIPLEQYQRELLQFSTDPPELQYYDRFKTDVVFHKCEEVWAARDYLEEKYSVILKLIG
jgi:hypothetical protein